MKLINRDLYLDKLLSVRNIPDIKIITGVRRSGKSKLLDSFYDFLVSDPEIKNIIRIKLNLKKFESLLNPNNLYEYIDKKYVKGVNNYLIIDEIQECVGFERIINSLYEEERFDILSNIAKYQLNILNNICKSIYPYMYIHKFI